MFRGWGNSMNDSRSLRILRTDPGELRGIKVVRYFASFLIISVEQTRFVDISWIPTS